MKRVQYENVTLEDVLERKEYGSNDNLFDLVTCSEVIEHVDN